MKKIIISILVLGLLASLYLTQVVDEPGSKHLPSKEIRFKKEPKKFDKPGQAAQWISALRQTSKGGKNAAQLNEQLRSEIKLKEKLAKLNKTAGSNDIPNFQFEDIGPGTFGGRVRAMVIKQNEPDVLLVGSVSGGIWKSLNDGLSWQAKADFLPNIAVGSMVADPDDPDRVFVGTGEGVFNFGAVQGAGIFISNDFGESWDQLASTNNDDFYYVNRMVRIPDSQVLLVATSKGIFRSENLGQSWVETSGLSNSARGFMDLKMDPSNDNHLLAVRYDGPNERLTFAVTSPMSVAGNYEALQATFGPDFEDFTISGEAVLVDDGSGVSIDGCEAINNDVTNKIAIIQRGSCNFTVKVKNAQNAGAIAVVVYNNSAGLLTMGGEDDTINIPSAFISQVDGEFILSAASSITGSVSVALQEVLSRAVLRSLDAGISWEVLDNNGLPVLEVDRMELAFGNDGVIYVAVAKSDEASTTLGLWRSPGGTANFVKTASDTQFIERQGWFDLAIAVHPDDSDKVFMGAVDQFVSNNKGATIVQNSFWSPGATVTQVNKYIHADHHGYFFSPSNPDHHYATTDGGIYKTEDNGASFFSLNNGLNISQSYGIAVSPDGKRVTSGTQDNGSKIYFGDNNAWLRWRGGDGGYSAWDQQSDNFVYGSNPRGEIFGSNDGGNTVQTMTLPDTTGALFIQPLVLDPGDGNRLLVGTDNVFYSSNARLLANATWQDVSGELPSGSVSALSFSPVTSSQIYVGMQSGHIYTITALGSANNVVDISTSAIIGAVTSVIADSSDPSGNTLYATRGGYFADRISKSTNGGNSWFSISGDLPDMPLYRVSVDPTDSSRLFAGSEMGLWVTESNGSNGPYHWVRYHYGPAFTRVIDLVWHQDDTLFIATHGRGTYKASRNGLDISLNKFITTDSSCDNDGVLDAGESGLLMVNLTNKGGFEVKNAILSIAQQNTLLIENDIVNVGTIPAMGSVFVPIEASLVQAASCLTAVDLDISVNYTGGSSQTVIELITAADQAVNLTDFTDGAESPETMMQSLLDLGNSGWTRVSSSSNSGANSWFTTDEASHSDKSLISPWLTMDAGGNELSFALSYNTEGDSNQRWDGALLEIREQGGTWIDIGNLSSVPYDGRLFTNNTAQARMAWSGQQVGWRSATVDLAETYKGKTIQFRFRMISDSSVSGIGFFVDDIRMSNVIWNDLPSCDSCQNTGSFVPFSGFWYDRGRSGHGFVVEPVGRDNLYFVVFYSYDDDGKPEWYTSLVELVDGVLNIDFEAGTLQRVLYDFTIDPTTGTAFAADPALTDGRLSIDFNLQNAASHTACQDGVARQEDLIALVSWKINSQQGDWCIEPLIAESNKANPDFGGIWWSGSADSGWGFSLAQTKNGLVAVIYYYDASGKPRWVIGQADFSKGETITIQMNEVEGFGRVATPIPISTVSAGSLQIKIDNALNNLNIDGSVTVDISYQGVEGGQWQRVDIPIGLFTQKH